MYYNLPNMLGGAGKYRTREITSKTVTLTAGQNPQDLVRIPELGDLAAVLVKVTASATGTLIGAKTLDKGIAKVYIKDKKSQGIITGIEGDDLDMLERFMNVGRARTVPTVGSSSQSHTFLIPLNVERKDMPAELQMTVGSFNDFATSGATGGSVAYTVHGLYMDNTQLGETTRITRIDVPLIASDSNSFPEKLPKDSVIEALFFKVGSESNINKIDFSADGAEELSEVTPAYLGGIDNCRLVDGHVSNQFDLNITPFVANSSTRFKVSAGGAETMKLYLVHKQLNTK